MATHASWAARSAGGAKLWEVPSRGPSSVPRSCTEGLCLPFSRVPPVLSSPVYAPLPLLRLVSCLLLAAEHEGGRGKGPGVGWGTPSSLAGPGVSSSPDGTTASSLSVSSNNPQQVVLMECFSPLSHA